MRVLVVDDHDGIRTLVLPHSRMHGIATTEAKNGRLALDCLAAQTFDAVTLDLMMPELDGYGCIDELCRTRPDVLARVVVMTAYPKTAIEKVAGRCAVVSKPFNATDCFQRSNAALGTRSPSATAHARGDLR